METGRKNLEKAQVSQETGYDKNTRPMRFYDVGDKVHIKNHVYQENLISASNAQLESLIK